MKPTGEGPTQGGRRNKLLPWVTEAEAPGNGTDCPPLSHLVQGPGSRGLYKPAPISRGSRVAPGKW